MAFAQFDRNRLRLRALAEREHDVDRSCFILPDGPRTPFNHPALPDLAERIVEAASNGRAVIFCCGAHVLRKGNGPLLIDLMKRGLLSHLALNGAGAIHDFELAMIGQTCESVARYVSEGQFGLWEETGRINEAAIVGHRDGLVENRPVLEVHFYRRSTGKRLDVGQGHGHFADQIGLQNEFAIRKMKDGAGEAITVLEKNLVSLGWNARQDQAEQSWQ